VVLYLHCFYMTPGRAQEILLALGSLILLVRLSCETYEPPTTNVLVMPMCVGIKRLLSTFTVL